MRPSSLLNLPRSLLKRAFVRDVLTLQIGSAFGSVINLVKSVLYFRFLGVEQFGMYAVAGAFTGTFSVFTNIGQNQAALTFFAEKYARKDKEGMASVMRYYLQLSVWGCSLLVALILLTPLLANYFGYDPQIALIARIAFAASIAGSFDTLFTIVLQTVREIRLMTVLENINAGLQLLFALPLLLLWKNATAIYAGLDRKSTRLNSSH